MNISSNEVPEPNVNEDIVDDKKRASFSFFSFMDKVRKLIIALDEQKLEDAPSDGNNYVRKDGAWVVYP